MYLGHTLIPPSTTTKYLGIHINDKLIFNKHISTLKASTFTHLLTINKIRPYITSSTALTKTHTLILTRLHYYIYGIPKLLSSHNTYYTTIFRLTNRSLRLIYRLKKTDYIVYTTSRAGHDIRKMYNRYNYNYTLFSYNRYYYNYFKKNHSRYNYKYIIFLVDTS